MTNLASVKAVVFNTPEHVSVPIKATRLDQRWGMFAPKPLGYSLYPLVEGTLRDGSTVELFGNENFDAGAGPANRIPPFGGYGAYPGYRWRKVFERVNSGSNRLRGAYGSYLCRQWNHAGRPRPKQLATVNIRSIRIATAVAGEHTAPTEHSLWQHWCFPEFAPKKD